MFFQGGGGFSASQQQHHQHHQNIVNSNGGGSSNQPQHGFPQVTTINRTNNGLGVINNGAGIRTITPDIQNDHNIPGGGGVNNMSYSFHGSGSVVLGGGLAAGPGSGVGGSGLVGPPPEGYVSANVFSELQNEVSSLLEFKNALLETFPHLHNRFGGSVSPSSGGLAAPTPIPGMGGSTSPLKQNMIHPQQQNLLHHNSSSSVSNGNLSNAISATPNHSQRISSPSPAAGMGRISSPVAPNNLAHYNSTNNNNVSSRQQLQHHHPASPGFDNINQHIIDQHQHHHQDMHENSWDQSHHQPHNQNGPPGVAHVPPVVIGSNNTGTLPRRPGGSKPPVVIRKSPENSNSSSGSGSHLSNSGAGGGGGAGVGGGGGIAADSGFNSETKDMMIPLSSNGLPPNLISPSNTNQKLHMLQNQTYVTSDGVEVRWDHTNNMWMVNTPTPGGQHGVGTDVGILQNTSALHQYIMQKQQQLQVYPHQMGNQQQPQIPPNYNFDSTQVLTTQHQHHQSHALTELTEGGGGTDDELMFLFDVIHRKSVRLRKDIETSTGGPDSDPQAYSEMPKALQKHLRAIEEIEGSESSESRLSQQRLSQKLSSTPGAVGSDGQKSDVPLEVEVDVLRREREILLQRIGDLELENANNNSGVSSSGGKSDKSANGGKGSGGDSNSNEPAGIIHSVHIRTGGSGGSISGNSSSSNYQSATNSNIGQSAIQSNLLQKPQTGTSSSTSDLLRLPLNTGTSGTNIGGTPSKRSSRSASHSDLLNVASTADSRRSSSTSSTTAGSVNIEIKNIHSPTGKGQQHGIFKTKSQDYLSQGSSSTNAARTELRARSSSSHNNNTPSGAIAPSVSVVNLRNTNSGETSRSTSPAQYGNVLQENQQQGNMPLNHRARTHSFGTPQYPLSARNTLQGTKTGMLLPGRMGLGAGARKHPPYLNRLLSEESVGNKGAFPENQQAKQSSVGGQNVSTTGSNYHSKSKSVENLQGVQLGGGIGMGSVTSVLGLKSANSEMNVASTNNRLSAPTALGAIGGYTNSYAASRQARLKGTTSELNVSRIGVTEKLRVDPLITIDGIASMPPEVAGNRKISTSTLALGSSGSGSSVGLPVKPNREKIRAVLKMSNVIELQRQLLTTVMENEVYRTQLERVSDNWSNKIGEFDRLNGSLRTSLQDLQQQNDELKIQVNRKNIELEGTKVRLKLMERNVTISGDSAGGSSSRTNSPRGGPSSTARSSVSSSRVSSPIGQNRGSEEKSTLSASTNAINSTTSSSNGRSENRVHFDLKNSDITKSQGSLNTNRKSGNLSSSTSSAVRRLTSSQPHHLSALPLDARQRLEEMAGSTSHLSSPTTGGGPTSSPSRRSSVPNTRSTTNTLSAVPAGLNPLRSSVSSGLISSARNQGMSPVGASTIGKHLDPIQESHQQTVIGAKLSALSALKKPLEKEGKVSSTSTTAAQAVTVSTAKVSKTASASLPTSGGNQAIKSAVTKPIRRESVGGTGVSSVGGVSQSQQLIANVVSNNNNNHFHSRSRPQTPSSRDRSLNAKNQQHSQDGQKSPTCTEQNTDELSQHNHEIGIIGGPGDSKSKVRPKTFWGGWWKF